MQKTWQKIKALDKWGEDWILKHVPLKLVLAFCFTITSAVIAAMAKFLILIGSKNKQIAGREFTNLVWCMAIYLILSHLYTVVIAWKFGRRTKI